jgi:hypothetical protein
MSQAGRWKGVILFTGATEAAGRRSFVDWRHARQYACRIVVDPAVMVMR